MIQDFVLETDDLDYFATILHTLLPLKLRHRTRRLYLDDSSSGFYRDGSEYCHDAVVFSIGCTHYMLTPYGMVGGATKMTPEVTESLDLACQKANAYNREHRTKPMYQFVTKVGGLYTGADKPKDARMYGGFNALVNGVIEKLKAANREEFLRNYYHPMARSFDGTVTMGYRLSDSHSFTDELHVTLCHIFYGK
jgi:hypothetical protein